MELTRISTTGDRHHLLVDLWSDVTDSSMPAPYFAITGAADEDTARWRNWALSSEPLIRRAEELVALANPASAFFIRRLANPLFNPMRSRLP